MRWLFLTALLALLPAACSATALAQASTETASEHRPGVTVEVHTERPPEGSLRRGYFPAPGWALYLGGATIVLLAAGALALRVRRGRRK